VALPWLFTAAQTGQQLIASQSQAEYFFGQAIDFSLFVQGSEPISVVTLFYRSADMPVTTTINVPIEPDQEVMATYTVDLTQIRLAPFTTVSYWWQVTDIGGNIFDIAAQSLTYEDDRFEWQQLSEANTIVRWTSDDPAVGRLALDIVNETMPRLTDVIPGTLPDPLRIYIYPAASDLQASLRLTGRDWVGGHANPELGVILVTAANARTAATDLRQSIPHELTHLMLYQVTGSSYGSLPRWFNEGLATVMEANPDPNEAIILEEALAAGTTIPFAQLCGGFPLDGRQVVLAYAQSTSLLRYIQTGYGNGALNRMVVALADGADCESVVSRELTISLAQLNQDWLRSLNAQPSLSMFVQDSLVWLLLLVAGFVLMVFFLWPVRRGDT
jgi:hypothetical protein